MVKGKKISAKLTLSFKGDDLKDIAIEGKGNKKGKVVLAYCKNKIRNGND